MTSPGDVQIIDCCGLGIVNTYAVGSYTEIICVPTDGSAIVPLDATVTNIVYSLTPCNCTTTTTSTTTTTTTGQVFNALLDDTQIAVCTGNPFNNVYVPQGQYPISSGVTIYQDPGCTVPLNITNYIYITDASITYNDVFQFDPLTGVVGTNVGSC